MDIDANDDLTIQRIAGGSVIEYPPVFSQDAEVLFIIWNNVVRAFSTTTGEWIRDLEGANSQIINVHCHPQNPKLIYACTESGELISWKWKSGVINETITFQFETTTVFVKSFHFINLKYQPTHGFLTWRCSKQAITQMGVFDLSTGTQDNAKQTLNLAFWGDLLVDVSKSALNFIAVAVGFSLHVLNYDKGKTKMWKNAERKKIKCVACHPQEELIATGDETGKIFLWRRIFENCQPATRLYHWHHTVVNSIAFTESGSNFYSGGNENVLVRWTLQNSDEKDFLPRMLGSSVHIAVGNGNKKIAVSTNDNAIQILNSTFKAITMIQNFTWVPDDKTGFDKFPIGLKTNPRTTSLVMNGRMGHLQFFSTHTRSLLYNVDTTIQNRLNVETDKVLYNQNVNHAAFNMDWMATAELLDDRQHAIEVRLKFWKFDVEKQTYTLNTQVEIPHNDGVTALEFSSQYSNENLICASAGRDNQVKIWTLDDRKSIYNKQKVWSCSGKTNYKDLRVCSLAFSSDGSLLAVGFGDTLCVYIPETLHLKCVLSAPAGLDGGANKLIINLPLSTTAKTKSPAKEKKEYFDKRKRILQTIKSFLNTNDTKLIKDIASANLNQQNNETDQNVCRLSSSEQKLLATTILRMKELHFYQKIEIFQRLQLHAKLPNDLCHQFNEYLQLNNSSDKNLNDCVPFLGENVKFLAKRKQFCYANRRTVEPQQSINTFFTFGNQQSQPKNNQNGNEIEVLASSTNVPIKMTPEIKHVVFGSGDFSHLIIACTENRILIWNLLTLRLQTSLKISVDKIVVDQYTSLVAAFTKTNELYVFLPNSAFSLYHRKNLPSIYGAAWIPRRYPKSNSINLDWQATSQLYFLSTKQELLQLVNDSDIESISSNAACISETLQPLPFTPFGAMIAKQIQNDAALKFNQRSSFKSISIGVPGKGSVKEIANLQNHTMPPINLLCNGFLKSLTVIDDTKNDKYTKKDSDIQNERKNDNEANDTDMDSDKDSDNADNDGRTFNERLETKRIWLNTVCENTEKLDSIYDQINKEKKLQKLFNEDLKLKIELS